MSEHKDIIRQLNTKKVLNHIYKENPISRADLSKALGLTKATISSIVEMLIDKNLVIEVGSEDIPKGRKPILLTFNKKSNYIIGIDINKNNTSIILTDLFLEEKTIRTIVTPSINVLGNNLIHLIDSMTLGHNFNAIHITSEIEFRDRPELFDTLNNIINTRYQVPLMLYERTNLPLCAKHFYSPVRHNMASLFINEDILLSVLVNDEFIPFNHNSYFGKLKFSDSRTIKDALRLPTSLSLLEYGNSIKQVTYNLVTLFPIKELLIIGDFQQDLKEHIKKIEETLFTEDNISIQITLSSHVESSILIGLAAKAAKQYLEYII